MRRHIYETRLVPLGKPVSIPVVGDGTSRLMTLTFNDKSFELERTARTKPEVWVNHDRALRIGQVAMLYTSREFWCCDWLPDRDIPDDIEFEVGQPISVGLSQRKIGSGEPYLRGISIVRHGAIEGAKIVRRSEIKPAPVKPTTSPAAGRTTSDLASSPASTYYAPVLTRSKRDLDDMEELNRRLDWLERTGRSADYELVLTNLQDELHGRSLEREYAPATARRV